MHCWMIFFSSKVEVIHVQVFLTIQFMIFTKLENIALCLFNMGQELFWRNILLKQLMFSLIGNNTKCISKVVGLMELIIVRKKVLFFPPPFLPSDPPLFPLLSFFETFLLSSESLSFFTFHVFHHTFTFQKAKVVSHFHFLKGKSCSCNDDRRHNPELATCEQEEIQNK